MTAAPLDGLVAIVVATRPSLRSKAALPLTALKALRWRGPGTLGHGANIIMVPLGYFLIAAVAAVAASALIGLFLTNLLIGHFKNSNRVSR